MSRALWGKVSTHTSKTSKKSWLYNFLTPGEETEEHRPYNFPKSTAGKLTHIVRLQLPKLIKRQSMRMSGSLHKHLLGKICLWCCIPRAPSALLGAKSDTGDYGFKLNIHIGISVNVYVCV